MLSPHPKLDTEQDETLSMNGTNNDSPSLAPWHWGWSAGLVLIVLITLAFRYALPVRDGDLWWHMLYGRYFLEHKTLIADHTIFSWTPATNDTIYCTWLPDIFLYLLHKSAGLPGLFAFRYFCMQVPVLACFLFARRHNVATHPLTWLLCLLAVIMSYTAAFEKPEILSYVFMTLLAWNWWHIRATGENAWRNCYLFPLIMLVWVNSHGGFVFGTAFLVLIALGELLNTWLSPNNVLSQRLRKHLLLALLLTACTILLTPYGHRYPLQLFFDLLPTEANTNYNKKILAYVSPFDAPDSFFLVISADIALILLLSLLLGNLKKAEWSSLTTNLFFAFLFTLFFRTTFYWVPIFLFSSVSLLSSPPFILRHCHKNKLYKHMTALFITIVAVTISTMSLYRSFFFPGLYLWMGFGISDFNPVAEAEYIATYFPKTRLGNTYDQGGYLLWKLWPGNTVFFDPRHFPYRSWSDHFFDFTKGNDVEAMLQEHPCDLWCIGLAHRNLLQRLLQSQDWQLAYYGKNAAILLRRGIPLPETSPRVSPDIITQKNHFTALNTLAFACDILDLNTAQAILASMKREFTFPPHAATLRLAAHMFDGTRAYAAENYAQAVEQFTAMKSVPDSVRFMLGSSYYQLCAAAWRQRQDTLALRHALKAWELEHESPHALFNLGAILWYYDKFANTAPDSQHNWRTMLQAFLKNTATQPGFDMFRSMAQSMLAGRYLARPCPCAAPISPPTPCKAIAAAPLSRAGVACPT